MDTARLRLATQAEHLATEAVVPLMEPGLTRESYVRALEAFYRIVRAWDIWAGESAPADLKRMLEERRHASLLADDLRALGAEVPGDDLVPIQTLQETVPPGDARSIFLGRMYVMEGSTLGGQLLARHVEDTLGLEPGVGDSYFRGYGEHTGQRWKEFKAVLEALPDSETETVIAAAGNMFTVFRSVFVP